MSDLPTPDPVTNPETEPFWEATAEERLLLRRCNECGRTYHYPRTNCPHCLTDDTEWVESTGVGTIYSYTITHQSGGSYGEATPYVLAYVQLDEGPRVLTNIVGCDPEEVAVGQVVEVTFDDSGGDSALYRFRPRDA